MAQKNTKNIGEDKPTLNTEAKDLFDKFPACKKLYRIPTGEFFTEENMALYNERDRNKIEIFKREDFYTVAQEVVNTQETSAE
jgi:hypothetical protein